MSKYITGVAILLVLLVLFSFNVSDDKISGLVEVASAITIIESSHDFGDINIFDGKVSTTYILENNGTEDVVILSGVTSCMCTEGEIDGLEFGMHESSGKTVVVPAGKKKILTTTFDPLAHGPNGVGKIKREVLLKTNSTETPEVRVVFVANVIK